ncbi:hypothetical protein BDB00DRAFT_804468 [Zychaea mexicana]|uniref:uncharacterized protein n=1 Tax=Zychaea mexicana TaxID=64656 RepID=UPI0022FE79F5|nr:uncharacterized protein BDB00DRAFT_804468 [Zychaea mexicana]KAI9497446.1 hypothetical protein BDB00DRAFT_804468 [Zychaea mexicana]
MLRAFRAHPLWGPPDMLYYVYTCLECQTEVMLNLATHVVLQPGFDVLRKYAQLIFLLLLLLWYKMGKHRKRQTNKQQNATLNPSLSPFSPPSSPGRPSSSSSFSSEHTSLSPETFRPRLSVSGSGSHVPLVDQLQLAAASSASAIVLTSDEEEKQPIQQPR